VWQDVDEDWPLGDIPDNADLADFLRSKGYAESSSFGGEMFTPIDVWWCRGKPYVVSWSSCAEDVEFIYAPAAPDLIELLALLTPTATAKLLGEFAEQMEMLGIVLKSHPGYRDEQRRIRQLRENRPKRPTK
jgi:hypothetical protein